MMAKHTEHMIAYGAPNDGYTVKDADEAVELHMNAMSLSKCRDEYAEFIPELKANIARYACILSLPTELPILFAIHGSI